MSIWLRIILAIVISFVVLGFVAAVLELNDIPVGSWPASSGVAAGFLFLWFTKRKAVRDDANSDAA